MLNFLKPTPPCQTFYQVLVFHTKVLFCQNVTREKLYEALSYKKHALKMLMKLTPQGHCVIYEQANVFSKLELDLF
jgi:hypothetical protein